MRIAIVSITSGGEILSDKLCELLEGASGYNKNIDPNKKFKIANFLAENWTNFDAFICIMAAGIVVRSIAQVLGDKRSDPAVLVLDEKGKFVISLLSGHLGGANYLAHDIAEKIGATPVITTSSDTLELVPLDLWAKNQNLVPPEKSKLTAITAKLVNTGYLLCYTDLSVSSLPRGLQKCDRPEEADIIISCRIFDIPSVCYFRPQNLVIGIGCNRGTPIAEFENSLAELFQDHGLHKDSIRNIASVDKKNDEIGLLEFGTRNGWNIDFYSSSEINELKNLEISFAALRAVGAIGVAEPCALLSADSNLLLCRKRKWKNVTIAVAQVPFTLSEQVQALSNK